MPRTSVQRPWPLAGKVIAPGDFMIGVVPPIQDLQTEFVDPMNLFALHQSRFSGVAELDGNRRQFSVAPGQFSYVPKGTSQLIETEESGEILYLRCGDKLLGRFEDEIGRADAFLEPIDHNPKLERSAQLSALVIDYLASDGFGGRLKGEALASLMLCEVMNFRERVDQSESAGLGRRKLERVQSYIDAHSDDDLSLATLAEIVGVSTFHFSRMFKMETGMTPHQFVMQHRVNRARAMLRDTDTSLAEIAYNLGFSSQSHMTECFKRFVGASPGRYKRMIRE